MKYYLSSYKIGNEAETLRNWLSNRTVGYIPNALDFTRADLDRRKAHVSADRSDVESLGIRTELLDLRTYFGKKSDLATRLRTLDGIWISGGNVFVLRQAMKLSGLDEILQGMDRPDFVYAGYSAAGCVLSPTLAAYAIVDDATDTPYEGWNEVIWEGLGLIDVAFMPHYDSPHPESADIDKEIRYCEKNGLPYKALRDGEVWIIA